MKTTKILALVLCVAMMVTMFAGCGKATVMTVNDYPISEGVYTYYYSYMYAQYGDMYGEELTRSIAESQIMRDVAVREMIKELGLELTSAEKKAMVDARNYQIESMSRNTYVAMLKAMNMTAKDFESVFEASYLASKLFDYYYGENGIERPDVEDLRTEYMENYIRASHVLLSTEEATTDEERAEIRKTAERVRKLARNGADFVELIKEYGQDPGLTEDPETGYYFTTGEMVAEFEEAAYALEENAISDIVETPYGFHIIKRLPMDETYVDELVNSEDYYNAYCEEILAGMMQNKIAELTPVYEDALSTIDFSGAISYWTGV